MNQESNAPVLTDRSSPHEDREHARMFPTRQTALISVMLGAVFIAIVAMSQLAMGQMGKPTSASPQAGEVRRVQFMANGEVKRPDNWRSWIFIGANLTPNGLNDGKAFFPEYHFSYIEPSAWEYYRRTGEFSEGTQIVKELVLLSKGNFSDGSTDSGPVGRGFYSGKPVVLAFMYKDTKRFPDKPGGWAYYDFGSGQPYKKSAKAHANETCSGCHEQAETDYVFTQYYPVTRERKSDYAPRVVR